MDNRPIGIFDSGVGGMTVAREVLARLPHEKVVYFGDTGRAPYGPRTGEQITAFTLQICDFLVEQRVKALVVACNTICVSCIDELRRRYPVPVIGVIEPGVEAALEDSPSSVGLMATQATVASGAHRALLQAHAPAVKFQARACPLFVPLIEEGFADTPIAYHAAREYLKDLPGIDTLILGCTHYPIMKAAIAKAAGEGVDVVDPSLGTVMELQQQLEERDLLRESGEPPEHCFYMSGNQELFEKIMGYVFGMTYPTRRVRLGE